MRLSVTELERVDELVHTCSKGNSLRVRKEYAGNQTASYIKEMNLQLQTLLIKKIKLQAQMIFLLSSTNFPIIQISIRKQRGETLPVRFMWSFFLTLM